MQDQTEVTRESRERTEAVEPSDEDKGVQPLTASESFLPAKVEGKEFDWLAVGIVLLIAGLFALVGRLSPQPATSLTPVAVLSATGCGLLVTAIRKLHTPKRPGLLEASVGGLFLAVFQFIAALTYPNVPYALSLFSDERTGFLTTWMLIAVFSVVFSMIGAVLGHLAFAPLRPLPAQTNGGLSSQVDEDKNEGVSATENVQVDDINEEVEEQDDIHDNGEEEQDDGEMEEQQDDDVQVTMPSKSVWSEQSLGSYLISVLLLGLAPMIVGYVFAAAFDYMLRMNLFFPGPYPTLRLLSTMLPWQVPLPVGLNSNDPNDLVFLLWLLWRIPLFLGNPTMFDVQALEPLVFNGAALALLLLVGHDRSDTQPMSWLAFLLLEAMLGLVLVLPADVWIGRGLQGLLQGPLTAIPIRTLHILDSATLTLNLITGPVVCVGIGIFLRLGWRKRIV